MFIPVSWGYDCKVVASISFCVLTKDAKTRLGGGGCFTRWLQNIYPPGVVDQDVEKLARYTRSKTGRAGNNSARDFYRWVHRDKRALDVPISKLKVRVCIKQRRKQGGKVMVEKKVDYPVIYLSSWVEKLMMTYPQFFLGGHDLHKQDCWAPMLAEFWHRYEGVDPNHKVHLKSAEEKSRCIPMALHGDEGRGLAKTPLMVWSFQVIIPCSGPNNLNTTKHLDYISAFFFTRHAPNKTVSESSSLWLTSLSHSFTTRLLYSLIPSSWYARDSATTIDGFSSGIANDFKKLFSNGVTIQVPCHMFYVKWNFRVSIRVI